MIGDWQGCIGPTLYLINQNWQVQTHPHPWQSIASTVVFRTTDSSQSVQALLDNSYLFIFQTTPWNKITCAPDPSQVKYDNVSPKCRMHPCHIFLFPIHFFLLWHGPLIKQQQKNVSISRAKIDKCWWSGTQAQKCHVLKVHPDCLLSCQQPGCFCWVSASPAIHLSAFLPPPVHLGSSLPCALVSQWVCLFLPEWVLPGTSPFLWLKSSVGCQAPSIERPYRKLYHVFPLLAPGLKELGTQCRQVNNLPLSVSSLLPEGLGRMYPEEEHFALTTYFF